MGYSPVLLVAVLSSLALLASPLGAQTVTGHVVDSISGTPVGVGFVVLLDQENREVARSLSDGDGSFSLSAPAAGFFRIRSERIGYQAFTSGTVELAVCRT